MKIAIVGAGLTGLSAAIALKEYANVVVFEKDDVGGLASSYCREYCIEKFYHHCFRGDNALLEMIKKLGLSSKLVWKVARIGYAVGGKVYPLNTPFEILRYPHMSFMDKAKLALFTIRSKRRDYTKADSVSVVDGIRQELGDRLLEKFFMPLLKAKFGESYPEVSYAWLLARVSIRSNRKYSGEELGYLRHGFHQLIERMREDIEIMSKAARIEKNAGWVVNGERFDAVIYTAPLPELDEKIRKAAGVQDVKYQSSVCALIGAKKSITEDIYWTNVDRGIFGAIIEHTHFMPFEDYGEHVIYLASYSSPSGWLFNAKSDELRKLYLKDVARFGLEEKDINWIEIFRAKYSGPIYEKGYLNKITPYRTALKGLYIAGMTSKPNYPERSMNGSIKAGMEVAEVVKADLEV
ncbi:NAD(P)/FAD-dependent oxidoreductase [Archaeoglobus veneficus]|uniref:Amine oxidase n=1 Tax=Archaeoglobus veneficus (strain DSM 11195 / SNP6) TaxID=693661 RepID=F2KN37_ARCVS|nr:NAD(P)/FAD-dependent oxidoreductase [Archaeoglobus veneficus]AEA47313.1 amine oxidase [Archaeoglobus veneficus SNP6]